MMREASRGDARPVGARTGGGLDRRPIGAEGLGLGALGGIGHGATGMVRVWGLREHGGGEARQRVPREKRTVGSQIGGSTNAPRPSRGRRAEGMGDDGTRDTASTRARTNASAGRLFAGGLRDATHVTRFVNARVLILSHAPRECVRLPKQHQCREHRLASLCGDASACVRRGLGSGRAGVCVRD
jgi:hypothetical protein